MLYIGQKVSLISYTSSLQLSMCQVSTFRPRVLKDETSYLKYLNEEAVQTFTKTRMSAKSFRRNVVRAMIREDESNISPSGEAATETV